MAQHRGQGRGRTDGEQGGHDGPGAPVATGHQGPECADRQRRAGPEGQLVGRRSPDGPAHWLLGALLEQLLNHDARTEGRGVGRRVHCPGPGVSAGARGQPPRPGRRGGLPEGDRTQGRGCRQPGDHALLDRGARHQARLEPDRGNQSGGQCPGTCCGWGHREFLLHGELRGGHGGVGLVRVVGRSVGQGVAGHVVLHERGDQGGDRHGHERAHRPGDRATGQRRSEGDTTVDLHALGAELRAEPVVLDLLEDHGPGHQHEGLPHPLDAQGDQRGDGHADVGADDGDELREEALEHRQGQGDQPRHPHGDHHEEEQGRVDQEQDQPGVEVPTGLLDGGVPRPADALLALRGHAHEQGAADLGCVGGEVQGERGGGQELEHHADGATGDAQHLPAVVLQPGADRLVDLVAEISRPRGDRDPERPLDPPRSTPGCATRPARRPAPGRGSGP